MQYKSGSYFIWHLPLLFFKVIYTFYVYYFIYLMMYSIHGSTGCSWLKAKYDYCAYFVQQLSWAMGMFVWVWNFLALFWTFLGLGIGSTFLACH